MTKTSRSAFSGLSCTHVVAREDAVIHHGREYVPTSEQTKWVGNLEEFSDAGGIIHFNEDQTEVTLTLPAGCKFGIGMMRKEK